ncbi:MAG: urea ABC transporter permease subunit UrtB [Succinatimonas sp.]|jgi:urea transport system permease protein|nr:urea ABC transporter permease subunit UrtB [Succinatimonas sp.]MDD5869465.1 urea ABC transporter permease subunit UrtB [Succinatimonas sp.]MDY5721331.1 urea ABC transporter permease subunit UrtB [Succinivibrio sp.]
MKAFRRVLSVVGALSVFLMAMLSFSAYAMDENEAMEILANRSSKFDEKALAISELSKSEKAFVTPLLNALNNSTLYFDKKNGGLYIATQNQSFISVTDNTRFQGKKRDLKKVAINNSIREDLALTLSIRALTNPVVDIDERINEAYGLVGKVSSDKTEPFAVLRDKAVGENEEFAQALNYVIAAADLDSEDAKIRNGAMRILEDFDSPVLVDKFQNIADNDSDVSNKIYAKHRVADLNSSQKFYSGVETLYFGLSLGSVLVLAAIGLTVTFGVMGVINMAHGELMMIGAYTTYVMQQIMPNYPGIALLLSIPAAFIVAGLVGIVIERSVIRYLYGRPLETLLATFGISLLLQQAVRSIFTALNKNVVIPDFMAGSIKVNEFLLLTYNRLYIIIFCLAVFFGLRYFLQHSTLGVQVRAVSQNRAMARNMGVHSGRVNALTFGLGSAIAGLAGVALSQLTNVGPNLGQNYIVDSFLVVVFGGAGNIWGTLVAGMTLGIANKVVEPIYGAMLAKIIILVAVILFIQKRPRGLFPQRGRSVED